MLKQVNDQSGDISGLANTCLGALAGKVEVKFITEMLKVLLGQMKTAQDPMKRDVAYLGLKSVIQNLGSSPGSAGEPREETRRTKDTRETKEKASGSSAGKSIPELVAEFLGPQLIECIESENVEIASNGYDVLLMFLTQHGPLFPGLTGMAEVCGKECENPRPGIRKKAMQCLGKMSASLPIADFHALCRVLIDKVEPYVKKASLSVAEMQRAQSLVMSLSFVGRGAGFRMGEHVPEVVSACMRLADLGMVDDEGHGVELVESCLVVLELCMLRCPREAAPLRAEINEKAIACLAYDPNYNMDSDMENGDENEGDVDGSSDEYSDDEGFSDDDDSSWKVRRAACKVLSAEIKMYAADGASHVGEVYAGCEQAIVKRTTREREETVRQEVFNVYLELLEAVYGACTSEDQNGEVEKVKKELDEVLEPVAVKFAKMIRKQSAKIRVCVFKALTKMVASSDGRVLFGAVLSISAKDIVAGLKDDTSSTLQLQILQLLEIGLDAGRPTNGETLTKELVGVIEETFECAKKKYFALAAAALRVCQKVVYLIRPDTAQDVIDDLSCLILPLFTTVMEVLSCSDKPQEVKNAAITCSGHAIAQMGDLLEGTQVEALAKDFASMRSNSKRAKRQGSNETNTGHMPRLTDVVSLLVERLGNETTRLSALVAIKRLIESPLHLDIYGALGDATSSIKSYLRKLDRHVRIMSVETLAALMTCCAGRLEQIEVDDIVVDVSGLISDDDLGVSNAVIALLGDVVSVSSPDAAASLLNKVIGNIHSLLSSNTLQTSSLDKLINFFERAVSIAPDETTTNVAKDLVEFGVCTSTKQSSKATARCVASLAASSDAAYKFVNLTLATLSEKKGAQEKNFLLFCIRELGANQLTMDDGNNGEELRDAVVACMGDESTTEAAANALGGLASDANTSHLDFMVAVLSDAKDKKLQYPMLRALDEGLKIMAKGSQDSMDDSDRQSSIDSIVKILIKMNQDEDVNDEAKVIIAECYGLAGAICPDSVLPTFKTQLNSKESMCKNFALVALKSCILRSVKDEGIEEALSSTWLPMAMHKLADEDVSVRRSATLLLSLAAHTKLSLVKDLLGDCIPPLVEQTKPDESLIRIIDLGPFKHKIDDGLEQRKSAFDCLGILIGKCWDAVPDHAAVVESIVAGVGDEYDVKLKCHDLLLVLAGKAPSLVLGCLDKVIAPMTKTLSKRIKADGVKQEIDKNEDMLRSCMRACFALDKIDGSDNVASFKSFMSAIAGDAFLGPRYAAIKKKESSRD